MGKAAGAQSRAGGGTPRPRKTPAAGGSVRAVPGDSARAAPACAPPRCGRRAKPALPGGQTFRRTPAAARTPDPRCGAGTPRPCAASPVRAPLQMEMSCATRYM